MFHVSKPNAPRTCPEDHCEGTAGPTGSDYECHLSETWKGPRCGSEGSPRLRCRRVSNIGDLRLVRSHAWRVSRQSLLEFGILSLGISPRLDDQPSNRGHQKEERLTPC